MRLKKELTPTHLRCVVGTCPAVYETSDGQLVIIGKSLDGDTLRDLSKKIGADEHAVVISRELLANVTKQKR
jgi:hypothetical protein